MFLSLPCSNASENIRLDVHVRANNEATSSDVIHAWCQAFSRFLSITVQKHESYHVLRFLCCVKQFYESLRFKFFELQCLLHDVNEWKTRQRCVSEDASR